jgi:hypothetical protein
MDIDGPEKRDRRLSLIIIFLLIIAITVAIIASHIYSKSNTEENAVSPQAPIENSIVETSQGLKYTNTQYDFIIQYPKTYEATTTFEDSYFVNDSWRLYGDPGTGNPILSIKKRGSNSDLDAELRIGISTSTEDLVSCTNIPDPELASSTVINGVPFMSFDNSGAGLSHFITATSYRIVHNGACFNIDTFVTGVNIEVYGDPKRQAPFDSKVAEKELDAILHTFNFKYFRQFSGLFSKIKNE